MRMPYDSDVDEGPMLLSLFMAQLVIPPVQPTIQSMRSTPMTIQIFDTVDYQFESGEAPEEQLELPMQRLRLMTIQSQEQALVIQLISVTLTCAENVCLNPLFSGKEKSNSFLTSEKEKILSEKKDLADSYLDEIVCLKNANKVARDMLQRFNMPTQTIPMLSKKPKRATNDLHKDILGTRNPGLGYMAKRAQPVLYDADTLLHPNHHPVSIWDSEEVLVHQVVSMKKMNEKPGHVRPANGFYDKLNALMFVPQKDLSGDQAYWLSANEIASQAMMCPPSFRIAFCEDLNLAKAIREHNKVLELEAEVLKQQKMVIESEKRSTAGSCDQQAFETDRIQLKDTITSLRIQLDGLKVENVSLKRRYDELSKANTHSRTAYTAKLSALTTQHTKLQAQVTGTTSSGPSTSEKPKVLASGMYTNSSKYIPPPKRANWVKPTPLPKKKQVTFQEPPRTSNRPTQKPPVQQNKKPNVSVNLSTRTKPATESRKPMPKSHTRNHRILPSKSVNARRAADHNRKLNVVDHNQFVIRSLKSVNTKTPQAKHSVHHTKKVWKATRNHNVNTTKTAWRPTRKVVGSVKPQWRPTGRHFALYDNCPLTRIMEPIVEPLELTPSVSSSSKVTMISRFTDCKLSDRKAGSKGLSDCNPVLAQRLNVNGHTVADSIAETIDTTTSLQVQDRLQDSYECSLPGLRELRPLVESGFHKFLVQSLLISQGTSYLSDIIQKSSEAF
ncbi:hypothetical protein Tco_0539908 [Tanacetum coccineum]